MLEGACYAYAATRDEQMKQRIDWVADLIAATQEANGFINAQPGVRLVLTPR